IIVVRGLEVPLQRPRLRIQRDDGRTVEIRPLAVAAVKVVRGRSNACVEDSALDVDRHVAPRVRAGAILPLAVLPRLVIGFAGTGNSVEGPHQLAGPDVPRTDIASRAL